MKQKVRKKKVNLDRISIEEIESAERLWIKDAQKLLGNKADFQKTRINLGVIEKDGIMVCKGRLENSDLHIGQKFPIIFPQEHRLTKPYSF